MAIISTLISLTQKTVITFEKVMTRGLAAISGNNVVISLFGIEVVI